MSLCINGNLNVMVLSNVVLKLHGLRMTRIKIGFKMSVKSEVSIIFNALDAFFSSSFSCVLMPD